MLDVPRRSPRKGRSVVICHTGERPFECTFPKCGKRYAQRCHLKTHFLVHTGERPYRCEFPNCGRAFAGSGTLHRHQSVHTRERRFVCPNCSRGFTRKCGLRLHMKNVHDMDLNEIGPQEATVESRPAPKGLAVQVEGTLAPEISSGTKPPYPTPLAVTPRWGTRPDASAETKPEGRQPQPVLQPHNDCKVVSLNQLSNHTQNEGTATTTQPTSRAQNRAQTWKRVCRNEIGRHDALPSIREVLSIFDSGNIDPRLQGVCAASFRPAMK